MPIARFYRPDGSLQFDASIPPYTFLSKETVTTVSTTGSNPHWSNNSPSTAMIPMAYDSDELIAVYLPGYGYARYGNLPFNGVWYHIYHTDAPLNTTVTYYRFRLGTQIAGDFGPGLKLYNEAGARTYHSGSRAAVVAGFLSGAGNTINLPGGRNYASVVQTLAGYERSIWDGGQEIITNDKGQTIAKVWTGESLGRLYGVKWNNTTSATLVEVPFDDQQIQSEAKDNPADSYFYMNPIENVMFLDVTGI